MPSKPPAPEPIPKYIVDALHRQDKQSLAAIEDYAAALREQIEAQETEPFDEDDLADESEELVDVEDSDGGTVVIKKVPCGKDCSGCPHGPYKYTVQRIEGGKLKWEYKGPVNE